MSAPLLDVVDMAGLLERVTYRPGWTIGVHHIDPYQGPFISICGTVANSYQPDESVPLRIHSPIPPMRTEDEFFEWLLWRCTRVAVHEEMEWLQVDGKPFHDPHQVI